MNPQDRLYIIVVSTIGDRIKLRSFSVPRRSLHWRTLADFLRQCCKNYHGVIMCGLRALKIRIHGSTIWKLRCKMVIRSAS